MEERDKLHKKAEKGDVNIKMHRRLLLLAMRRQKQKKQLWMWLVDLNYSFQCVWLIELSDSKLSNTKLSDNNLTRELVKNGSLLNQSQTRKF